LGKEVKWPPRQGISKGICSRRPSRDYNKSEPTQLMVLQAGGFSRTFIDIPSLSFVQITFGYSHSSLPSVWWIPSTIGSVALHSELHHIIPRVCLLSPFMQIQIAAIAFAPM